MGVEASATATTGCFCHSPLHTPICLWHRREQGRSKERQGEIQKWKGRSGFTRWPLEWEHPAPDRGSIPFLSAPGAEDGAGEASAVPGFQQNQQHSSPDFKGNWIRPMSRAFQRLILKSFMLITLPEGKQTVRSVCPHRHPSPQLKGLHLDEPHKWFYPLNKLHLAQFLILSKLKLSEEPGNREIHQERLLRDSNLWESWVRVPPALSGCSSLLPSLEKTWNKKNYR